MFFRSLLYLHWRGFIRRLLQLSDVQQYMALYHSLVKEPDNIAQLAML